MCARHTKPQIRFSSSTIVLSSGKHYDGTGGCPFCCSQPLFAPLTNGSIDQWSTYLETERKTSPLTLACPTAPGISSPWAAGMPVGLLEPPSNFKGGCGFRPRFRESGTVPFHPACRSRFCLALWWGRCPMELSSVVLVWQHHLSPPKLSDPQAILPCKRANYHEVLQRNFP